MPSNLLQSFQYPQQCPILSLQIPASRTDPPPSYWDPIPQSCPQLSLKISSPTGPANLQQSPPTPSRTCTPPLHGDPQLHPELSRSSLGGSGSAPNHCGGNPWPIQQQNSRWGKLLLGYAQAALEKWRLHATHTPTLKDDSSRQHASSRWRKHKWLTMCLRDSLFKSWRQCVSGPSGRAWKVLEEFIGPWS